MIIRLIHDIMRIFSAASCSELSTKKLYSHEESIDVCVIVYRQSVRGIIDAFKIDYKGSFRMNICNAVVACFKFTGVSS